MSIKLPEGWIELTLNDIANWGSGGTPKATEIKYYNGAIPWLIINDLNDRVVLKSGKQITEVGYKNSSTKWVEKGAVLIAMYGSIGKLGIAGIRCTTNQAIAFTNKIWGQIPNQYLFYYLSSQKKDLLEIGQGGAQKNISQTILKQHPFPLPPLNEQKRITAKLDHIMPRIDGVKDRLDRIPRIIKRFRQSVLTAAVTGKLTEKWREENPDVESAESLLDRIKVEKKKRNKLNRESALKRGDKPPQKITSLNISIQTSLIDSEWIFFNLGDLFDLPDIFDGPFGSNLKTSDYTTDGVRVIRLENIEFMKFNNEKKTYISKKKYKTLRRHTVKEGDIIFSSFISETVRTVMLQNLDEVAIAKADCFCLRPIDNLIDGRFLIYILSSQTYHDFLQSEIHGATRPRINTTQLKSAPIPLPPLEEQKEIVRQVDKLFTFADKLEQHYKKAKEKIDKLPQSVLAKAFRGELVPQDPNDEPAEKLLERIKDEKDRMDAELKKFKTMPRKKKTYK